ncbi:hypothetical protein UA08_05639 [Talaromyces atroroseus]|uniref:Putative lipoate-protein ligase A n=1 Tax=Talaromyces atroroseus TaxID=1441469 RepID=A0A225AEH2_TALAT|nr:hypothetical protein UA08_05639 [Talaromyces atroroseus]OKL58940.1 hypothetical protein UA08_05639 [Talaromyces atroroseus]
MNHPAEKVDDLRLRPARGIRKRTSALAVLHRCTEIDARPGRSTTTKHCFEETVDIVSMLSVRRSSCVLLLSSSRLSLAATLSARTITTLASSKFADLVCRSSSKHQIYQSLSSDPFTNLSIEQYLLQKTPEDSNILFLYINRPCVVVGRNQNPWLETNLKALQKADPPTSYSAHDVLYVRRHSGGGAVFHDEGNLNYSVICPRDVFTRDRHAEMVSRALRSIGASNATVNERHDIVLTQIPSEFDRQSNTAGIEDPPEEATPKALKVSGSAFKLTRNRALHHGTCLLDSPNINNLGAYLRSPARPYIHAKGVSSVRSPVGNVSAGLASFSMQDAVMSIIDEFSHLYKTGNDILDHAKRFDMKNSEMSAAGDWVTGIVGDTQAHEISEIQSTSELMKSTEFKFLQTPEFTFSTFPIEGDSRPRPPLPNFLPPSTKVHIRVKKGIVLEASISTSSDDGDIMKAQGSRSHELLSNNILHEMDKEDWRQVIKSIVAIDNGLLQPMHEVADHLTDFVCDKFGV